MTESDDVVINRIAGILVDKRFHRPLITYYGACNMTSVDFVVLNQLYSKRNQLCHPVINLSEVSDKADDYLQGNVITPRQAAAIKRMIADLQGK